MLVLSDKTDLHAVHSGFPLCRQSANDAPEKPGWLFPCKFHGGRPCKITHNKVDTCACLTMGSMFQTFIDLIAPYSGVPLLIAFLFALGSYAALRQYKSRLTPVQLRLTIRVAALIALPISWLAVQTGSALIPVAVLCIVWCIAVALTCGNEMASRKS